MYSCAHKANSYIYGMSCCYKLLYQFGSIANCVGVFWWLSCVRARQWWCPAFCTKCSFLTAAVWPASFCTCQQRTQRSINMLLEAQALPQSKRHWQGVSQVFSWAHCHITRLVTKNFVAKDHCLLSVVVLNSFRQPLNGLEPGHQWPWSVSS